MKAYPVGNCPSCGKKISLAENAISVLIRDQSSYKSRQA